LKETCFFIPDPRNWYLIRYFTNTNKGTCARLFPRYGCGADDAPDHGANHCMDILKNRDEIVGKFERLFQKQV
jgi:hypothetical protein